MRAPKLGSQYLNVNTNLYLLVQLLLSLTSAEVAEVKNIWLQ